MQGSNFDELVKSGLITNPEDFSPQDKAHLDKLTSEEVQALEAVSQKIRPKLGDDFLKGKAKAGQGQAGSPSIAIVF